MDLLVLHSPTAGDEEPSPGRLLALLRREGYTPHYFDLPTALDEPDRLPDVDLIVAAGGDGTFRQAVLRLGDRRVPFALLPVGTANNIAGSLGIVGSAPEVIASWDRSIVQPFNVGIVRGPWGDKRFVEGVGVGLFARIIRILENVEQGDAHASAAKPHRVASDLRATAVLAHEMLPLRLEAKFDGQAMAGEYLLTEILNIARVGAGAELAPAADTSDGLFDVVVAAAADRPKLLQTLGHALMKAPAQALLVRHRCQRIELRLPRCDLRIDDEVFPVEEGTEVEISMDLSATVTVKVPEADPMSRSRQKADQLKS